MYVCIYVCMYVESRVSDLWFQVSGLRSRVCGFRSQVSGLRSQVSGLKSEVSGLRSIVSILFFYSPVPISIGFPFEALHLINGSSTYIYVHICINITSFEFILVRLI